MADVGRKQGSEIVKGDLTRPWAPAGLIKENIPIYRRFHVFSQTGKKCSGNLRQSSGKLINHPKKPQTGMTSPPQTQ